MQDARPRGSEAEGLWLFWPDYSQDNPFQQMLHAAFPPGREVRAGRIDAAIAAAQQGRDTVFHLHWEDAIYRQAPSPAAADALVDQALAQFDRFLALGGVLVWTVHNDQPHEARFLDADRRLRREIARRARVVHMHSAVAAGVMAPPLGLDPSRVLVTPLGGFAGFYPDDIGRDAARRYFGLSPTAPVFVNLGAQRAYKGLDLVQDAFAALQERLPEARLILAGRGGGQAAGRFQRPAPGVLLVPRRIDDASVQYVLRAADWAVFGFRRIMVSSSVLLAETFGLPVIVPDLPTMAEMVQPGVNGFTYPAGDASALARLMLGAAGFPPEARAALGAGALADIARRDWGGYARALVAAAGTSRAVSSAA